MSLDSLSWCLCCGSLFQLFQQMGPNSDIFKGYKEHEITFRPSYKYTPGTDEWDSRCVCGVCEITTFTFAFKPFYRVWLYCNNMFQVVSLCDMKRIVLPLLNRYFGLHLFLDRSLATREKYSV